MKIFNFCETFAISNENYQNLSQKFGQKIGKARILHLLWLRDGTPKQANFSKKLGKINENSLFYIIFVTSWRCLNLEVNLINNLKEILQ